MFTASSDLILFQGHGSLAAGSGQSCMHTFQLFCNHSWTKLFFFLVPEVLLLFTGNSIIKSQQQKPSFSFYAVLTN